MAKRYHNPVGRSEAGEYADALVGGPVKGRGAQLNPGNRHETVRLHVLGDHLDEVALDEETRGQLRRVPTQVYRDKSKTLINRIDSPDVPFEFSINPYRGCSHGCIYCYARPDHERLGFSCGLDFETKIVAKLDAPRLLREELAAPSWKGGVIAMCGVTDCYQPVESQLRITRGCLEVMAECGQPVGIVTKNKLVLRDLDLLRALNEKRAAHVSVSVTTLDNALASKLEPRASSPRDRLEAVRTLAKAGIPVTVMVAPIVPGLTDREVPAILEAAADAGARSAGYVLLRLPHQVKVLLTDWLARHYPDRAGHVESLIRQTHGGELYDARFGCRKRGEGPVAEQIGRMFRVFAKRHGLDRPGASLSSESFVRPSSGGQLNLFAR